MTRAEALELGNSRFWEDMAAADIATFQLFEPLLCMPFDVFHKALEVALGRPVFTHELGLNIEGLRAELRGDQRAPTPREIMALIPATKRCIVAVVGEIL